MTWNTKVPSRFLLGFDRYLDTYEYCIGVEKISTGGGGVCWVYIDENGNKINIEEDYFKTHPLYNSITTITETHYFSNNKEIDKDTYNLETTVNKFKVDEEYIQIPKFYYKYEKNKYWIWIQSDEEYKNNLVKDGFKIHPAFKKGNIILKYIYIGKYPSIVTYKKAFTTEKIGNTDNGYPSVGYDFNTYKEYCSNRNNSVNTDDVYHMIDIYDLNVLQLLALIEYKTTDLQKTIWCEETEWFGEKETLQYTNYGASYGIQLPNKITITEMSTDTEKYNYNQQAWYRDIRHLWGNYWQYVDGLYIDKNGTINIYDNNGCGQYVVTNETVRYKNDKHTSLIIGCDYGFYKEVLSSYSYVYSNNESNCYDFRELFIPDTRSLAVSEDYHEDYPFEYPDDDKITNHDVETVTINQKEKNSTTFSDSIYLPCKSDYNQYCGFGGCYKNTGYEITKRNLEPGLFSYKFDFMEKISTVSSSSSVLSDYSLACTRLCKYNISEVDYS